MSRLSRRDLLRASLLGLGGMACSSSRAGPNFVVIFCDDLG